MGRDHDDAGEEVPRGNTWDEITVMRVKWCLGGITWELTRTPTWFLFHLGSDFKQHMCLMHMFWLKCLYRSKPRNPDPGL